MANWSANGSLVTLSSATLHVTNITLDDGARLTENTGSAHSSTNFDKVVADNASSFDIPWDDTNLPDTDFGLITGMKVTLIFNMGSSGKTTTLTNTTVERLQTMMNNDGDIVRSRCTTKGGTLTRPVT